MPTWVPALIQVLEDLLTGPLGGLLGGALSFVLLEIGVRRARARHDIAEAVAAELLNNYDTIKTHLDEHQRDTIPLYFRSSLAVFNAVASRLGELPFLDVVAVSKLYGFLDEYNRIPEVWNRRAKQAQTLEPPALAYHEQAQLADAVKDFYRVLEKLGNDCNALAEHLRTRHAIGLRSLLPAPLRRRLIAREAVARLPAKSAAEQSP